MKQLAWRCGLVNHGRSDRAYSLIELGIALVLVMVILLLVTPTVQSLVLWSRIRQDVSNVEHVIQKTMGESLARGTSGRVRIENGTAIGEVQLLDATFDEVERFTPGYCDFGRTNSSDTPWLALSTASSPTSFTDDLIPITGLGMVIPPGGGVFMSYRDYDGIIEVLPSGLTATHYQKEGSDIWSQ